MRYTYYRVKCTVKDSASWFLTRVTAIQNKIQNISITLKMSFMPLLLPASFWLLSPYLSIAYSWKSYEQNITVYIVLCLPSFPQSNGFWDSNTSSPQSLKVGKMYVDPLVVLFYCSTWLSSSCPIGIGCYIKEGLGEGAGLDENPSQYQNLETHLSMVDPGKIGK